MFNIETRANVLLDAMKNFCIAQIMVFSTFLINQTDLKAEKKKLEADLKDLQQKIAVWKPPEVPGML